MEHPYYETFQKISDLGIQLVYNTTSGGYHPLHWHEEIELLYQLNGHTTIQIEGEKYQLPNKHLTVIDSGLVHSTYTYSDTSMFLCVHISKKYMERYIPDIHLYQIQCIPDMLTDDQFPEYRKICQMLEDLTRIYIEDSTAYYMEAEGIILQTLAHLIRHFSTHVTEYVPTTNNLSMTRIRVIITYVENHFHEQISLQDIADYVGLGKEYFCRFFKKNMGISFLQYVNEVRISHIYQDLIQTDLPIYEIAENNGFLNQKLFNRMFKSIYGCTPSSARKAAETYLYQSYN